MIHQFTITLHSCGSCVSHSHCSTCCNQAVEDLLYKPHIQAASLDPVKKLLAVTSSSDRESLMDLLDDMGIFVESSI